MSEEKSVGVVEKLSYKQKLVAVQAEFCRCMDGKVKQDELAKMIGCAQSSVSLYSSGERVASMPESISSDIKRIAGEFEPGEDDIQLMLLDTAYAWDKLDRVAL